jgi:TonB family protein
MIRYSFLLTLVLAPPLCVAAIGSDSFLFGRALTQARPQIATGSFHIVKFAPLEDADIEMQCASTQPPSALATPHPSLAEIPDGVNITVNFIIGTDGQVYSPFILNGGGSSLDRKLVESVRHWRYRPALCNGVPIDAEVKVQLSSR